MTNNESVLVLESVMNSVFVEHYNVVKQNRTNKSQELNKMMNNQEFIFDLIEILK